MQNSDNEFLSFCLDFCIWKQIFGNSEICLTFKMDFGPDFQTVGSPGRLSVTHQFWSPFGIQIHYLHFKLIFYSDEIDFFPDLCRNHQ